MNAMKRILRIKDLAGEPIGSLCPVAGDPVWHSIQDLVADHFLCSPDDVRSIEPDETDLDQDEIIAIDSTPVGRLTWDWL